MAHPRREVISQFIPLEDDEHIALADWLRWNGILFHHSPNGGARPSQADRNGKRFSNEGKKMARMGTKKGFPDFLILDPPPLAPADFVGTALELKRVKGGTVSPEQRTWGVELELRRWKFYVAKGATAGIEYLKSLGYGRR